MSNTLDALKKIDKLSKELKVFQDLLKAKLTTSLEDEAPVAEQPSKPKSIPVKEEGTYLPASEETGPSKAEVRPMSPDVREILSSDHGSDVLHNLHNMHNQISSLLENRHPTLSPIALDRIENQIRDIHKNIQSKKQPQEQKPQRTSVNISEVAQKEKDKIQRLKFGDKLPSDKRDPRISGKVSKLSPMQQKAKEAERKVVAGYTGDSPKKQIQDRPGVSFVMYEQPTWAIRGQDKLIPSRTKHNIFVDGKPIGHIVADHSLDPSSKHRSAISELILGSDYKDLAPQIRGAFDRHAQGLDSLHEDNVGFSHQVRNFENKIKDREQYIKDLSSKKSAAKLAERFSPEELVEQRRIAEEENVQPTTGNFAPKAPITGFDREKAESKKGTSIVEAPSEPRKYETSEETKNLQQQKKAETKKRVEQAKEARGSVPSDEDVIRNLIDKTPSERELTADQIPDTSPQLKAIIAENQKQKLAAKEAEKKQRKSEIPVSTQEYARSSPQTWISGEEGEKPQEAEDLSDLPYPEEQPQARKPQTREYHIKNALNSPDEYVRDAIVDKLLQSDNVDHLEYLLDHSDPNISRKAQRKLIDLARAAKVKSA